MKKALLATFCITALFVLIILMFPFKENPVVETKTVSIQQEIVYAYVTTEMLTNGYGGVHGHQDYIWSGGRNCLSEQKAAYARGYDAGTKFIVGEAKKAPIIDPESMRPTAHWISDSAGSTNVVCSACNAISFAAYNFCPECGKRMVSVQKRMVNEDD